MRDRLDYLFGDDLAARWRIILTSALCVALSGFVGQSSGSTVREAQIAATVIGGVVFSLQVLLYVIPAHTVLRSLGLEARIYLLRSALTIAASTILALVVSVSAPTVQAAILNRRLKAAIIALETDPVHPARSAHDVFKAALYSSGQLRHDLVAQATKELKGERSADAWQAYLALLTYTVNRRPDPEGLDWRTERLDAVTKNVPTCGPRNEAANVAEFTTKDGIVTHVSDVSAWPKGILACRMLLDGATIKDTQLNYLIVDYRGGPATLENVRFTDVKFDLNDTPNARRFADALLHSENNVLTIHLD
jgi:hypothetical protein